MPDSPDRRRVRAVWIATALAAVIWLGLAVLAPWLAARGSAPAARIVYALFSPVCHQLPGRCFALFGRPMAVCGRCLGIYAGFAAGTLVYPFIRGFRPAALPSARMFALALLPMAVDGLAGVIGLWRSPIGVRAATGFVWGALLPYYFVPGVADAISARRRRRTAAALERAAGKQ
ncbi:MAG: DUF2085 domain-containing protein [Candidatus Aminicenantes bacterium]|jgi:uncharacterized membrane protein|nr:DUF2085 domain-containing protein [Candidatus Aminicenantes bacterium]NLH76465.1 DUF2085 domain-containing protein [Acidobacteriota bacterium]